MTKLKTLDQLRAEKERAETQLAQEQHKLEHLENRKKYLEKGERTKRTHRLCNEAMLNIVEGQPQVEFKGGTDAYENLILVSKAIHVIIHASSEITIREYLNPLQLDDSKLAKLNKLRTMAEMPVIML